MNNPANEERQTKHVHQGRRGMLHFDKDRQNQRQRHVLGKISVRADSALQARVAAITEPDPTANAHSYDASAEKNIQRGEQRRVERNDSRYQSGFASL